MVMRLVSQEWWRVQYQGVQPTQELEKWLPVRLETVCGWSGPGVDSCSMSNRALTKKSSRNSKELRDITRKPLLNMLRKGCRTSMTVARVLQARSLRPFDTFEAAKLLHLFAPELHRASSWPPRSGSQRIFAQDLLSQNLFCFSLQLGNWSC